MLLLWITPACKPGSSGSTSSNGTNSNPTTASSTDGAQKSYTVTGVVREIKIDGKTAIIRHDEIPGYMAAMTMPFEFRPPALTAQLSPGDSVRFRLQVTEDDGWVDEIEVLAHSQVSQAAPTTNSVRVVRDVDPLKVGDLMPNYAFTNEFGRRIQLSDYKGQALAFTFIFTRCPFPTFCPRMSENFNAAYRKLGATAGSPTNFHFLSISFDPVYDTPTVLRQYAQRYSYDSNKWSFASGALIDIDAITEQFGLYFSRESGTINFNHNLRTVVVDAGGRINSVLIGNEWKPEELADAVIRAAQVQQSGR